MFISSDDMMSSLQFHPSKVETFSLKKALMINAFQCKVVSSRYIHRTLISVMHDVMLKESTLRHSVNI